MSDVQPEAVAPEPTSVDDVVQAPEAAPESQAQPEAPAEGAAETPPATEPEKPKKDSIQRLTGRIGHLTKTVNEKDAELAEANRRLEAALRLADGGQAPAAPTPQPGTAEFQQAVVAEAARLAADASFNNECNKVFEQGTAEFKDDFKGAVENLNAMGFANREMIEAALATDEPAKVIHYLGADLDEAARIAALPPIRKAAELTKLATRLATPGRTTSNAPAPIKPIGGAVKPSGDVYAPDLSDEEYYARRKAQGAKYIR